MEETIEVGSVSIVESDLDTLVSKFESQSVGQGTHKGVDHARYVLYDDGHDDPDVRLYDIAEGVESRLTTIEDLKERLEDARDDGGIDLDEFEQSFRDAISAKDSERTYVEERGFTEPQIRVFLQQYEITSDPRMHFSNNVAGSPQFDVGEIDGWELTYRGIYGDDHEMFPDEFRDGAAMFFQYRQAE